MTRRAAKVTHVEVKRLIKAVQDCGLTIQRVTFDGERVDVILHDAGRFDAPARRTPDSFTTLEEYEAWRAEKYG